MKWDTPQLKSSFECVANISGDLLGDKGYSGEEYKRSMLSEQGVTMIVPPKKNQRDDLYNKERTKLNNKRRLVETVIGQLTE